MRQQLALALVLVAACGGVSKDAKPASIAVGPASGSGVAAGADAAKKSDDELRTRALTALDAGDLETADTTLREMLRRHGDWAGTTALANAVDTCTGRGPSRNHAFANMKAIDVSAPPTQSASSKPSNKSKIASKVIAAEKPEPDRDAAVFAIPVYPNFPTNRLWGMPTNAPRKSAPARNEERARFLPSTIGGNSLIQVKWSSGRWLGSYGRAQRDARFITISDPDGNPLSILDFRTWRTKTSLVESGIIAVELSGDTLFVRKETNASDGGIAAVNVKTGKTLWRSEDVGMGTNFVVADDLIYIWIYGGRTPEGTPIQQGFQAFDRATGNIVSRLTTPYVTFLLVPNDGAFVAFSGGNGMGTSNRVEVTAQTHHTDPPTKSPETLEAAQKLQNATTLTGDDAAKRLSAYAMLDGPDANKKTLDALLLLRSLFDAHPENFAIEALFESTRETAAAQRERATADLQAAAAIFHPMPATPPSVPQQRLGGGGSKPLPIPTRAAPVPAAPPLVLKNQVAPIPRTRPAPPKIKLIDEKETRRDSSAWFSDNNLTPNRFEIDESPSNIPLFPAPLWFPPNWSEVITNTASPSQAVGIFNSGREAAIYRQEKVVARNGFVAGGALLKIAFADAVKDVLFASIYDDRGRDKSLVAVSAVNGDFYWRLPNLSVSSFLLLDGYLVASTDGLGKKAEIVVIEADTGSIVSRTSTPGTVASFANRLAREGNTLWAFNVITTIRFSIE